MIASNKKSVTFSHLLSSKAYIIGQLLSIPIIDVSNIFSRLLSFKHVSLGSPTWIGLSLGSLGYIDPLTRLLRPSSSTPFTDVRSSILS